MTYLGRGRSHLTFHDYTVTKEVPDLWEPLYMRSFPKVFTSVISTHRAPPYSFTMPFGRAAEPRDLAPAFMDAVQRLRELWEVPWGGQDEDWRLRLRAHLFRVVSVNHLDVSLVAVDRIITWLPDVTIPVCIHGDPTLANCVFDSRKRGWYWIDPLTRSYVPGDPHVDLGKLYQSCLGYEYVLCDRIWPDQHDFMETLTHVLGLKVDVGLLWCAIHIIRLIPYQEQRHQSIFEGMFHTVWEKIAKMNDIREDGHASRL